VAAVRHGSGERRVGHGGTLDPLAQGVLVLALGQATRLLEYLAGSYKTYIADLVLGVTTDTYDAEGQVVDRRPVPSDLRAEQIEAVLDRFRGQIEQTPPIYSAVKVRGKAAFARARAGQEVILQPRRVEIVRLEVLSFEPPSLKLAVTCSAGTYIRSLAHDLGEVIGCGAMLAGLVRTASGCFRIEDSVSWPVLQKAFQDRSWQSYLLPADLALAGTPRIMLDEVWLARLLNGAPLPLGKVDAGLGRAYDQEGRFVAVLSGDPARGLWLPKKVLTSELIPKMENGY
jgi:tRNA pseudouridine55 synthase